MDCVVTLPQRFGLARWIEEGDPAGQPWSGQEWAFTVGGGVPDIRPGERVYVAYAGRLIGYAPLTRIERRGTGIVLVRRGGAVAVTIKEKIPGFRGWKYRDWAREEEVPFPDWHLGRPWEPEVGPQQVLKL